VIATESSVGRLLIAFAIARVAVRVSRRAEGYVQEIYRRASLTEIAAELVHDLCDPLMALRANAKALPVSPDQAAEIAVEFDPDIVALNQKLSGFLDLTRHRDEQYRPSDLDTLIRDAARLAEPVVRRQGLEIEIEPHDLAGVFVPVFTTKVGGNGLGLSIVRRIVETHQGRVRIENRAGGGVRVTLILPLEQPEIPGWWKP
jgi:signal transduction histidine kinase